MTGIIGEVSTAGYIVGWIVGIGIFLAVAFVLLCNLGQAWVLRKTNGPMAMFHLCLVISALIGIGTMIWIGTLGSRGILSEEDTFGYICLVMIGGMVSFAILWVMGFGIYSWIKNRKNKGKGIAINQQFYAEANEKTLKETKERHGL